MKFQSTNHKENSGNSDWQKVKDFGLMKKHRNKVIRLQN